MHGVLNVGYTHLNDRERLAQDLVAAQRMRYLCERYGDRDREALGDESHHDGNDVDEQRADIDVVRMILFQPSSPNDDHDDCNHSSETGDDDNEAKDLALQAGKMCRR